MRIKIDENLPAILVAELRDLGHEVDSVPSERLAGQPDPVVWEAAQRAARFLITQDLDFSDIRKYAPGTHQGLLLVRLVLPGRLALARRVRAVFQTENVQTWAGCFVVVSDHKVRVRRPPPAAPSPTP